MNDLKVLPQATPKLTSRVPQGSYIAQVQELGSKAAETLKGAKYFGKKPLVIKVDDETKAKDKGEMSKLCI